MAVRPGLQPGQLHEKAGVARGYEALGSDQSSDQVDQDGWATGAPCQEASVSACRGVGDQGNADWDTGTDQPASAGTWVAEPGGAENIDVCGSSHSERAAPRERLGQRQAILGCYAWKGGGFP